MAYRGDPWATAGLGAASFINGILIRHPCLVLRRQCQIHPFARSSHFTPVTLVPVMFKIANKDGLLSLWKGSIGSGVLWAISQVTEVIIGDIFSLPRSVVIDGSRQRFWQHVILKAATFFVSTPFLVSSFVESVRSGARADDARLLDVVWSGTERLHFDFVRGAWDSKRFAIIHLAFPTTVFYTAFFLVSKLSYDSLYALTKKHVTKKLPSERTRFHTIMPEIFSGMTSMFFADLLLYPAESVLHRLYIQGTRTLVDNLDNGAAAISIGTRYSGVFDCIQSMWNKEGVWAFYNGVGAVFLQYALQFGVMVVLRMTFDHIDNFGRDSGKYPPSSSNTGRSVGFGNFDTPSEGLDDIISISNSQSTMPQSLNFPTFSQTQAQQKEFGPFGAPKPALPTSKNFF